MLKYNTRQSRYTKSYIFTVKHLAIIRNKWTKDKIMHFYCKYIKVNWNFHIYTYTHIHVFSILRWMKWSHSHANARITIAGKKLRWCRILYDSLVATHQRAIIRTRMTMTTWTTRLPHRPLSSFCNIPSGFCWRCRWWWQWWWWWWRCVAGNLLEFSFPGEVDDCEMSLGLLKKQQQINQSNCIKQGYKKKWFK